jgi:CheY-like chemotaxis protein
MVPTFSVLLAEDNPATAGVVQNCLFRLGCTVTVSTSAEEAIELLRKSPFDAVFAELCIRKQGGRGIARWVKSNCSNVKFFIITSWKGELEPNILKLDGIDGIIRKPLIFSEIRDKMLDFLG